MQGCAAAGVLAGAEGGHQLQVGAGVQDHHREAVQVRTQASLPLSGCDLKLNFKIVKPKF